MMKPNTPQYAVFSSTEEGCCYLLCSDIIGYAPLMDAFLGNEMFEADEVTCHHQFVLGNERLVNAMCYIYATSTRMSIKISR